MILVTGGAGYIGCHVCVELLGAGYGVVVLDNLSNSKKGSCERVEQITRGSLAFEQGDLRDREDIARVFEKYPIQSVVHLAGSKSVAESVRQSLGYYQNNVLGSINLLLEMQSHGVSRLVFSSSATVYGEPRCLPLTEDHPLSPVNPYGRTKLLVEQILNDLAMSDPNWGIVILRYFNPVGAHSSGLIGEDPRGVPANLLPFVAQVAVGRHGHVNVWGADYPTRDGTGIRDYVHVVDLAVGHVRAIEHTQKAGILTVNLGTGRGYSVLEVIDAFGRACGREIPFVYKQRRDGDVASCYADAQKAGHILGWKATRDLQTMCADHWRWQQQNPNGY